MVICSTALDVAFDLYEQCERVMLEGGAASIHHHDWSEFCSAPQEGDQQSQHAKTLAELQARKNAIDITGAICRTATDLLHRSHSQPGTALYLTFPECIHHPEDFTEAVSSFSFTKPFSFKQI